MKPRLYMWNSKWFCELKNDQSVLGFGYTPKEAYENWKKYCET